MTTREELDRWNARCASRRESYSKRAANEWNAARKRSRVCVKLTYTYTLPFFHVDGHPNKPLRRMERVIIVPHYGPLTDDALWEHVGKLAHKDGRTRSGTRLPYYQWLGDHILVSHWSFCTSNGRFVDHLTPRQRQVRVKLEIEQRVQHRLGGSRVVGDHEYELAE